MPESHKILAYNLASPDNLALLSGLWHCWTDLGTAVHEMHGNAEVSPGYAFVVVLRYFHDPLVTL